jgi:hypothetical protein
MENITITIKRDDSEFFLKVPIDSDIEEWKDYFNSILTFLTFHPDTIKELFNEE